MSPNPRVGAVVVGAGGAIVGRGWHRQVGGPHAEAEALAEAGERARGGTLYVTLEPCSHHGRTPPCADAVVAAGVARVVACHGDPDPRVAGRGFARLRQAGIEVEVGEQAAAAVRLNVAFLVAAIERRPAVTLKWAMSLDGRIATAGGESQWISAPAGRRWALALREEHDATLVGSGTALADDPRLDRRLGLAGAPGVRVVLDRRLRLAAGLLPGEAAAASAAASETRAASAIQAIQAIQATRATRATRATSARGRLPLERIFAAAGPLLVYTETGGGGGFGGAGGDGAEDAGPRGRGGDAGGAALAALAARGATVIELAAVEPGAVLADLYTRGVRSVLVEGGAEVLASFAASGLYDRVAVDCAPLLIGGRAAPGPLGGAGAAGLAAAPRLERLEIRRRGPDVILDGLRQGCVEQILERVLPG